MNSSRGAPASVHRFTDATPPSSAARAASSAGRRSARPAHSACPAASSAASMVSSMNDSCLPSLPVMPPAGWTRISLCTRSRVAICCAIAFVASASAPAMTPTNSGPRRNVVHTALSNTDADAGVAKASAGQLGEGACRAPRAAAMSGMVSSRKINGPSRRCRRRSTCSLACGVAVRRSARSRACRW